MAKRIFDIIFSLLGLVVIFPGLLTIAIIIYLKISNPVLFRQKRVGRQGKIFTLYKFRTMVVNHTGSSISVLGEKRITPLGSVLRKYKLDELPELWNVLKGDMSFVGPRPDTPNYIRLLENEELKILELRPGLTSPASIKYSNEEKIIASAPDPVKYYDEVIWPDKVRVNLEYYYGRSFFGDILIIFKTIFKY